MSLFNWIVDKLFSHDPPKAEKSGDWPAMIKARLDSAFDQAETKHGKLDRNSIVDLQKALGYPEGHTSYQARKEQAENWGYPGDLSDSAAMNEWLWKETMTRLNQMGEAPRG